MKLSPNAAHVIAILLACAGAVLHFLQVNPDISNEAHVTSNALITLGFVIALVSQSVFGTATPPTPTPLAGTDKDPVTAAADALKPPAAHRGFLGAAFVGLVSAVIVVAAVLLPGCNPSTLPTIDTVLNVVAADIQAGDAPPQIDSDVCKALGGSTTTDAVCANVTLLVEDALQLLLDGGKITSAQAAPYLAAHPKTTVTVTAPAGGK
jgi:hypothetical protein